MHQQQRPIASSFYHYRRSFGLNCRPRMAVNRRVMACRAATLSQGLAGEWGQHGDAARPEPVRRFNTSTDNVYLANIGGQSSY
jgi:hypothetical protein